VNKFLRNPFRKVLLLLFFCLAASNPLSAGQPFFDAHLHYNIEDELQYPPEQILAILRHADVSRAVVTGRPPQQAMLLHQRAPSLVLPILGVYRTDSEKQSWMHDSSLPARVETYLAAGPWRGIGELHIFAQERRNPVFLRLVELAAQRSLPLLMHCDPAVIDALFDHAPQARVVWAHAGAYPYPPLLRDYLDRYPNLYVDLSVRDERVAPSGVIAADWEWLLMEYPDRFLVGVDTFRTARWGRYRELVQKTRVWLGQLPPEVSAAITHRNGERVFVGSPSD